MEWQFRKKPFADQLLSSSDRRGRSAADRVTHASSVEPEKLRRPIHHTFGVQVGSRISAERLLARSNLADPQLAGVAGLEAQRIGCAGAGDAKKIALLVCHFLEAAARTGKLQRCDRPRVGSAGQRFFL